MNQIISPVFLATAFAICFAGAARADEVPASSEDSSNYQKDSRLQVKITSDFRRAKMDEILRSLQQKTGVPLAVQPPVVAHQVVGQLKMGNAPAWWGMRDLEKLVLENGHWEKQGDGYVLTGAVRSESPAQKEDEKQDEAEPQPTTSRAGIWIGAVVLWLVLSAALIYVRHFVRNPRAQAEK